MFVLVVQTLLVFRCIAALGLPHALCACALLQAHAASEARTGELRRVAGYNVFTTRLSTLIVVGHYFEDPYLFAVVLLQATSVAGSVLRTDQAQPK